MSKQIFARVRTVAAIVLTPVDLLTKSPRSVPRQLRNALEMTRKFLSCSWFSAISEARREYAICSASSLQCADFWTGHEMHAKTTLIESELTCSCESPNVSTRLVASTDSYRSNLGLDSFESFACSSCSPNTPVADRFPKRRNDVHCKISRQISAPFQGLRVAIPIAECSVTFADRRSDGSGDVVDRLGDERRRIGRVLTAMHGVKRHRWSVGNVFDVS